MTLELVTQEQLRDFEDQINEMVSQFRKARKTMEKHDIESVQGNCGNIRYCIEKMDTAISKINGKCERESRKKELRVRQEKISQNAHAKLADSAKKNAKSE